MSDISYGQPQHSDYHPEITVRDLKSPNSRCTRVNGSKSGRVHQLLSDMETRYFFQLEWANNITDIREQFPLDIDETKEIAASLRVKHPAYKGNNVVMTTDFLVSIDDSYVVARTVKPSEKLQDRRILEKFNIEKRYRERRNVSWAVVTEHEIDRDIADNMRFFHRNRSYIEDEKIHVDIVKSLIQYINSENSILSDLLDKIEINFNLDTGQALSVFKCLVFKKVIKVKMREKFSVAMNTADFIISGDL